MYESIVVKIVSEMELSQKRYEHGKLLFMVMMEDNIVISYDVRYYYPDEDNQLKPSKNGFRLSSSDWNNLLDLTCRNPTTILEEVICKSDQRTLIARYCENYGGGLDIRYYKESKKYTGWEKRGIRISNKDLNDFYKNIRKLNNIENLEFFPSIDDHLCKKEMSHFINYDIEKLLE